MTQQPTKGAAEKRAAEKRVAEKGAAEKGAAEKVKIPMDNIKKFELQL